MSIFLVRFYKSCASRLVQSGYRTVWVMSLADGVGSTSLQLTSHADDVILKDVISGVVIYGHLRRRHFARRHSSASPACEVEGCISNTVRQAHVLLEDTASLSDLPILSGIRFEFRYPNERYGSLHSIQADRSTCLHRSAL